MGAARTITILMLMGAVSLFSGCKKKNPNVPPPQSQAPTLLPEIAVGSPPPVEDEPPSQTQITTGQPPLPELPKTEAPVPRRSRAPRRPAQTAQQPTVTAKKDDKPAQPTAPQGQLTASVAQNEALHQKLTTAQLIDSTESTLRGMNRS